MTGTDNQLAGRTDAAGYLVLDRQQCLDHLAVGGVGRVAVNVGALPTILPVHFTLHGDHVLFSISEGSTLDRATRDAVVAFEADGHDAGGAAQWSVTATGMARHVSGDDMAVSAAERLPAAAADGRRVVAVSTEYLSGRRSR